MTKTDKRKKFGEVFTPISLVNEMLDKLPIDIFTTDKTVLDNSCGTGNFLVEILNRRISNGMSHKRALETIYGVELQEDNVIACRANLMLNSTDPDLLAIVNRNIVHADALTFNYDFDV